MTKTKFMIDGTSVSIFRMNEETALDVLPPRVYTVNYSEMFGFYLTITKDLLQVPSKIYGNTFNKVDKCIATYAERNASTGILLTGDKGTGKSLMMSLLANRVISDLHMPVILIKEPYTGEKFLSFIEDIGECALIFDEFGKMYSSSKHGGGDANQESLLSLMDGIDKTKRMIILTENNVMDINEYMLNRPSRIYYHFQYKKMDETSINEYCVDFNIVPDFIKEIIELSRKSRSFSFDMLQSIVEERLRFVAPLTEIIEDLNIDTREDLGLEIEIIKVLRKDTNVECKLIDLVTRVTKPVGHYDYAYVRIEQEVSSPKIRYDPTAIVEETDVAEDDDNGQKEISFTVKDLVYESAGQLIFETSKYQIVAKEVPTMMTNYSKLF